MAAEFKDGGDKNELSGLAVMPDFILRNAAAVFWHYYAERSDCAQRFECHPYRS